MSFYTPIFILTELLMLAMTLHVAFYAGFTKVQKRWYFLTFISVMFCSAAEYAVHCGYYSPTFAIPLTILTVLQFSLAPMLGFFFVGALGSHERKWLGIIFFGVCLLTETICAPFGWIFHFGAEGYSRGDYFIIYEIFYAISLIYLVVNMVLVGYRFHRRDLWTIVMILIVIIAGIVPMTILHINITYLAIAVAASLCYIYYNDLVQQDTLAEVAAGQKRMSEMQSHMITGMASLIESRDLETGEHIARTSAYVRILCEVARRDGVYADIIDDHFILLMQTLAPMHDVGKIVVPDAILQKPGKLTPEEFEIMKRHASMGGDVIRNVLSGVSDEEYLYFASDIATYHHEWWDGRGYPKGLKGEEIPLSARIMAIADVFDALISERCYKKAMPAEKAFAIIEEESGTHFDPKLVEVFLNHKDEVLSASK